MTPRLSTIGTAFTVTVAAGAGSIYASELWSMVLAVLAALGATAIVLLSAVRWSTTRGEYGCGAVCNITPDADDGPRRASHPAYSAQENGARHAPEQRSADGS